VIFFFLVPARPGWDYSFTVAYAALFYLSSFFPKSPECQLKVFMEIRAFNSQKMHYSREARNNK
jgi:hypothetical protein